MALCGMGCPPLQSPKEGDEPKDPPQPGSSQPTSSGVPTDLHPCPAPVPLGYFGSTGEPRTLD